MFWDVFYSSLELLIGVGVFLVGIALLTDKLTHSSATHLRAFFKRAGKNRFTSATFGAGATVLIQSSTATSVMTVGLVNIGVLTFFQGMGIVMGASIGTAISTVMVSLSVFKIKYLLMFMVFVGATIRISNKKPKWVNIADILISLGILFVGLELMSMAFSNNATLHSAFTSMFEVVKFPLLLILIGIVFVVLVQSSTAVAAILISMLVTDVLTFHSALYLLIGADIGTSFTALLASINTNPEAKRVAIANVLFKFFGSILFVAIIWPLESVLLPAYQGLLTEPVWQLVIFNIFFNIMTVLVMIWFIKPLGKLAGLMIRDKTTF